MAPTVLAAEATLVGNKALEDRWEDSAPGLLHVNNTWCRIQWWRNQSYSWRTEILQIGTRLWSAESKLPASLQIIRTHKGIVCRKNIDDDHQMMSDFFYHIWLGLSSLCSQNKDVMITTRYTATEVYWTIVKTVNVAHSRRSSSLQDAI